MAGAWAALGYGLLLSAPNQQEWHDLEAGGRFAANLAVYLPYYILTLPVAIAVVLGLLWMHGPTSTLLTLTSITIAGFVYWITVHDVILEAQPQLGTSIKWCIAADIAAVVALLLDGLPVHRNSPNRQMPSPGRQLPPNPDQGRPPAPEQRTNS